MQIYTVQIRERGQLTFPRKVQTRLALDAGDALTLVQINDIILLSPRQPVIPKLAEEFSQLMDEAGVTPADLLQGLGKERKLCGSQRKPFHWEDHSRL